MAEDESETKKSTRLAPPTEVMFTSSTSRKLNQHWARPVFLQYNYLYKYYHNYYDDYIDYMDSRMRGLVRDKPRPQTWAERALRTYARDTYSSSTMHRLPRYQHSNSTMHYSSFQANTWRREFSKDYCNRKYKSILL
ncbi:flightin isoform X2 [Cimex lectularius]|nr:flightin isoform X2 [Cimex lectularius]XP_024080921.1 flightin isoform X2 [Cimex lectularius]XP_024080922.1 flightin isoform X2 [Cimex lectularius]XP_024080923.1 flightin isoform X2 [Cimex lectularius]